MGNRATNWRQLACLSNAELGNYDIALVNLSCAAGLPGSETIDIARGKATLAYWAELVEFGTRRMASDFERRPEEYEHSPGFFRMMVLLTVLQRNLGIQYNPALRGDMEGIWPDSADRFIHGVLHNRTGTCASLPPFYAAIGRRLGYPLKLVSAPCHLFLRWEGQGERFNIECTVKGLACEPDDHYISGRYQVAASMIREGNFLNSQTPREELAGFLTSRAFCWLDNENYPEAAECFALASQVGPSNRLNAKWTKLVLERCAAIKRLHEMLVLGYEILN
jgi:hypothetical protein